jgi:peroxiredoxin
VNQSGKLVDSIKNELNREFPKTDQKFFEAHKFFRMGSLDFALNQGRSSEFMKTYFSSTKPIYDLNAYATLFDQQFTNYFTTLATSPHQSAVAQLINNSDIAHLDEYFQKQLHFHAALSHWVLLKSMKDAYYSKLFDKTAILKLLDQVVQNSGWSDYEKETARFIRHDLTYLTAGTSAPEISLVTPDEKTVSLSAFKGSYIYLHFTDPQNIICTQHLDALKKIAEHYNKEKLVIVNVIPQNQEFKNERGWAGIFATSTDNLAETYKVKTYPTSFLISKEGKLLYSPAPNPIDGLDRQLGQLFKSDYLQQVQKNKGAVFR